MNSNLILGRDRMNGLILYIDIGRLSEGKLRHGKITNADSHPDEHALDTEILVDDNRE